MQTAPIVSPDIFNRSVKSSRIVVCPLRNDTNPDTPRPRITRLNNVDVDGAERPTEWEPTNWPAGVVARVIEQNGIDAVEFAKTSEAINVAASLVADYNIKDDSLSDQESEPGHIRVHLMDCEPEDVPPSMSNQAVRATIGYPVTIPIAVSKHVEDSQGLPVSVATINGVRIPYGETYELPNGALKVGPMALIFTATSPGYSRVEVRVQNERGKLSIVNRYEGSLHLMS